MFLCPEEEGTVRGAPHGAVSLLWYHKRESPRGMFRLYLCAPASKQRSRQDRRHRRARGRPSTEKKKNTHPPPLRDREIWEGKETFYSGRFLWREVIRDHRESFQARARRDDDTSSVVDGCAEPSVDGMASRKSDVIAWRHRFRRRRARLAPSSRPILLWPWVTSLVNEVLLRQTTNKKRNK